MNPSPRGRSKLDIETASDTIILSSAFTSNVPVRLNTNDVSSTQKQQEIAERLQH